MNLKQCMVIMRGNLLSGNVMTSQSFDQVCTDSRQLKSGQLFIALKGEHFDGHAFIKQALDAGAAAVVVNKTFVLPSLLPADAIIIAVADTREALGWLACAWQAQFDVKKVAITGSCGKTTVKELVAGILSQEGNTLATQANFNNEIGVPLTLLSLQAIHRFAVIEQGASRPDDILYTNRWVQPQVAVLLNAAAAHLQGFGSLEAVVRTKGQILKFIQPGGHAVINGDDPHLLDWLAQYPRLGKRLLFSQQADRQTAAGLADVWLKKIVQEDASGLTFVIGIDSNNKSNGSKPLPELVVHSPLQGHHNVANILAAVAVGIALEISAEKIIAGIANTQAVPGRMQTLKGWRDGVVLFNDAYNANPLSVRAAIAVLAKQSGLKILVLGQMAELGENTDMFHQQMGEYARQQKIDKLYAVGPSASATLRGFAGDGCASNLQEIADSLLANVANPMTILIKGSRSAGMEKLLSMLFVDPVSLPHPAH